MRVRSATPTDGTDRRHVFVEAVPDQWYEVGRMPVSSDRPALRRMAKGRKVGTTTHFLIAFATRAFNIGLIRDWREEASI